MINFKLLESADALRAENARLRKGLANARLLLINQFPDRIRRILLGMYDRETKSAARRWLYDAMRDIIEITNDWPPVPGPDEGYWSVRRALCPLCECADRSIGQGFEGWAIPRGLEWHLLAKGRVYPCPVFAEVRALLAEHINKCAAE